ncbi:hypothetical protein ABE61_18835 [Lysinibacillus sphaericus]|uniref:hypothetical protein n=1 Tax=Lysinibacillus sphaericus TaxID=1421 RepID=UPI0018CEBD81|nr:hypothetical protein [Lysinibacillus sphaericus]MBG9456041.1 hypothetical protein [Lysinibacillus sphaericus]MBG9479328.1 hypothetical protein [Lysinibacillus sphaericus]MBG9593417.1 hypothetical protein [Lysinibacillus sphaericus]
MSKNRSVKKQVIVKNGVLPPKEIEFQGDIQERVEEYWKVELLLEWHPEYDEKIYVVKMTSKLGGTNSIFCLCSDLYDTKIQKELTKELVNKGVFYPDELPAFRMYIDSLKAAKQYTSNDEGYKHYILKVSGANNDEAEKAYRTIVEHAIENESVFPDKGQYNEKNDGIRFIDEKDKARYGDHAIAFEAKKLGELLEINNTKKLHAILGVLKEKGVFFPGAYENRRKVVLREGYSRHTYIFKIDKSILTQGVCKNV